MEPIEVITNTLSTGATEVIRVYPGDFRVTTIYPAGYVAPQEDAETHAGRSYPADMTNVSQSQIHRLQVEAKGEAEQAYFESRWDEVWADNKE